MMTIYLIRHAHAGDRSAWDGDDHLRPLSDKGVRQAHELAMSLGGQAIERVLTSPAVRCEQTVLPLAEKLGTATEPVPELLEGSDPTAVIGLMERFAGQNPALCTHGDLIPEVIDLLAARGMTLDGAPGNKKGSWWALETDGDRFVAARYHPPPG